MIRVVPDEDISQRRRNSIHRFNLRQIEKNRFPVKCGCVICGEGFLCRNIEDYIQRQYYRGRDKTGEVRHVCWGCGLDHRLKLATATLYRLVCAIPVAERDRNEIYPADFRTARIPLWREDNARLPSLRDYAGPSRFGIHQRAASSVKDVLSHLIGLPANDTRWALYLLAPQAQQVLKRNGRLYRASCWFPKITGIPFDQRRSAYLYPEHAPPLDWISRVVCLQPRNYAELARTRAAYNDRHGSNWNSANLTKTFRALKSINIPRQNIEARNTVIANLERDFASSGERGKEAA
jgi:hypothetical protein